MEIISSIKNDKIKYLRKLYNSQRRKREGKFILEGFRLIVEALKAGADFEMLFMTPVFANSEDGKELLDKLENDIVYYFDEKLMVELADTITPQGIIAVVEEPDYNPDNFFEDIGFVLVLDRIQDPGNMGTLIRTAVAAGFEGIIVLKGSVDIYNLKVLRATAGAVFNIPIINKLGLSDFKKIVTEKEEFQLISADLSGETNYFDADYSFPLMLVIGNEANGICNDIINISDLKIKIPIIGQIDSLNAAIAGGILCYEISVKNRFINY